MKFVCLGYIEERTSEGLSEDERNAMMREARVGAERIGNAVAVRLASALCRGLLG